MLALVVVTSLFGFGVMLAVFGGPAVVVAAVAGGGFDGSLSVLVAVVEGGTVCAT